MRERSCACACAYAQIETFANPKGVCALTPVSGATVLACPGLHRGEVRVQLYDSRKTRFIRAHETALAQIELSLDGSRLATCSEKGTLVRIFSTADGAPVQARRRPSLF